MSENLVSRANLLVLSVSAGFFLLIAFVTWDSINTAREARGWVIHTYEVINTVRELQIAVREAEANQSGYLLTGRDDFLNAVNGANDNTRQLLNRLQALTADNPAQQVRIQFLIPAWQRHLSQFADAIPARREHGLEGVPDTTRDEVGRDSMKNVEDALSAMDAEEQGLLSQRLAASGHRSEWVRRLVVVLAAITIIALLASARIMTSAYRRSYAAETQQRTLADRLRTTLESLSQGVAVFGPHRHLRNWNDCFETLLDLPRSLREGQTSYADIVALVAQRTGVSLESLEQVTLDTTNGREFVVYERTTLDGRLLEIRRTPAADGGFVLTISDMTRRAQADAVLRESQKMQAIGQLTGGIAHDFNNLLTVIIGNLELGKMKLDKAHALQPLLDRAIWASQRGATLTAQLLAFARKQPLAPAPVNLSDTLPELVPLLRRTLGEHIHVRFVDAAGLWLAMTDPVQLESAVLNLALNARDAMPGGGSLTIELANKVLDDAYAKAHAEVTPGDYVMIAVSDTGEGMNPEVLARAFEPFFTTKPDGHGTGLGLAMVFGFVKQSGGHIKIYSEPKQGTSVKIYLPRAIAAAAAMQRSSAPTDLPRGSATILVVEDEAGVREVTVAILRNLGYRVLEAADGEEGLRIFEAQPDSIDLLLTDVVLPGILRGRELAERITDLRPAVRVLYMSGYTENSIVHHGRLDDGVQLLGKPFKREQLARKVADVLAA